MIRVYDPCLHRLRHWCINFSTPYLILLSSVMTELRRKFVKSIETLLAAMSSEGASGKTSSQYSTKGWRPHFRNYQQESTSSSTTNLFASTSDFALLPCWSIQEHSSFLISICSISCTPKSVPYNSKFFPIALLHLNMKEYPCFCPVVAASQPKGYFDWASIATYYGLLLAGAIVGHRLIEKLRSTIEGKRSARSPNHETTGRADMVGQRR